MFIYTEDFIVIKYLFSPVFSYYLFWNPTKTSIICKDWEQGTVYDFSLGGGTRKWTKKNWSPNVFTSTQSKKEKGFKSHKVYFMIIMELHWKLLTEISKKII